MDKLVVLTLGEGDCNRGIPVTLQIWQLDTGLPAQITGNLPPAEAIFHYYQQWQSAYRSLEFTRRLDLNKGQVTNVSVTQLIQDCRVSALKLQQELEGWYGCEEFKRIREKLLQQLNPIDHIRLVIQTQDLQLQRLPWHLFFEQFLQYYPLAEVALSSPEYERSVKTDSASSTEKLKILAILGNSEGINVSKDRALLEQLPGAEVNFLVQPQRQDINDQLWEQPWDILFFAGHSNSQIENRTGRIYINQTDSLTIEELRYGLQKAISRGLKLAIFNSCDGLGLAQALADLQIPQIIVMREPVPDVVAQEFLKYFLQAFSRGESFFLAVRSARQRLQGLEDKFPFGTWLPVICHNPAETPLSWPKEQDTKQTVTPIPSLNREEYRDRQILLNKVKNFWVKGVLEKSLHDKALIELGLEERLDAVERPWDLAWETPDGIRQTLPTGTKVIHQFDRLGTGRTLLILGEPGSGKTTTLLELTRDLIARAEQDVTQPMPVVFNLSSWSEKQSIADWLVQELNTKYQIPKKIGKVWVSEQTMLLMLDGLDEVSSSRRNLCVQAINRFSQEQGQTEMVVCSRIRDYEALSHHLRFQGAIFVQPLNDEQIRQYLNQMGAELAGVREILPTDAGLQELVKSPLMLSIMAIAYRGMSATELIRKSLTENHVKELFDTYIERMFQRRGMKQPYSKEQATKWLTWLAQKMVQKSQTVFFIEGLQPNWLQTKFQVLMYQFGVGLLLAWIVGMIAWPNFVILIASLTSWLFESNYSTELSRAILYLLPEYGNLAALSIFVLFYGFFEALLWTLSCIVFRKFVSHPIVGVIFALINGLSWGASRGIGISNYTFGFIFTFLLGTTGLVIWELLRKPINPAETIKWSWKDAKKQAINGIIWGGIFGICFSLLIAIIQESKINIINQFPEYLNNIKDISNPYNYDYTSSSSNLNNNHFLLTSFLIINSLIFTLIGELVAGIIVGIFGGLTGTKIENRTFPNQGIWQSAKNSFILAAMGSVLLATLAYITGIPMIVSATVGLFFGLFKAGEACIKHFIMRVILFFSGYAPWNYVRFLNYAIGCIFLHQVGGGYIFVHRLLLEHFASREQVGN